MAKVFYSPGIELVLGALDTEHKLINRQKHLHDNVGALTKTCKPEIFLKRKMRDYKHKPARGAELAHLQHFGEAAKQTTLLMYAYKFPDTASDEQRTQLDQFRQRFEAQLKGPADPQAPLDKEGKQKHYYRFDNFVRAMIYQDLKS